MMAGASDYIVKDNVSRLVPAIERELKHAMVRHAQQSSKDALARSEAELRALFSAIRDVILMLDVEGRYLKIAPTDPTYLYEPAAELVGRTLHEVFPKEQADYFLSHIHHALRESRMHRVDYRLQIGSAEVWFEGSVTPNSKDSVLGLPVMSQSGNTRSMKRRVFMVK